VRVAIRTEVGESHGREHWLLGREGCRYVVLSCPDGGLCLRSRRTGLGSRGESVEKEGIVLCGSHDASCDSAGRRLRCLRIFV